MAVFDVGVDDGVPYVVLELLEGETLATALRQGALLAASGDRPRRTDRAGPGGGAREGHRPPRPEAGQHLRDRRRPRQDPRLRAGEADRDARPRSRPSRSWRPRRRPAPGMCWARPATWRRSRCAASPPTTVPTSSRSARSSTRCWPGQPAFGGDSTVERMTAILKDDPPPLPIGAVPPQLDRVVHRCLEKSPAQRFQSASDIAFALGGDVAARPRAGLGLRGSDGHRCGARDPALVAAGARRRGRRRRRRRHRRAGDAAGRAGARPGSSASRPARSIACRSPTPGSCPTARRSSTARHRADRRRRSSSSTRRPRPRSRSACRTPTCSRSRSTGELAVIVAPRYPRSAPLRRHAGPDDHRQLAARRRRGRARGRLVAGRHGHGDRPRPRQQRAIGSNSRPARRCTRPVAT